MSRQAKYPAKILLFGEYLLINDGKALAIPWAKNFGQWSFEQPAVPRDLAQFLGYISEKAKEIIDTKAWQTDLDKGLWFDSNIPEGYGAGSSGALVAAVYDRYVFEHKRETDKTKLRELFALMESYFHGNSSGFDPLVCYLKRSIILENNQISTPDINDWKTDNSYHLFLLDTHQKRQTAPLVSKYMEDCNDAAFLARIRQQIIPLSNACIDAYIRQDAEALFKQMRQLSRYQAQDFRSMIPDVLFPLWEKGLDSAAFALKLCGAGGGGYMLGIGTATAIESIRCDYDVVELFDGG